MNEEPIINHGPPHIVEVDMGGTKRYFCNTKVYSSREAALVDARRIHYEQVVQMYAEKVYPPSEKVDYMERRKRFKRAIADTCLYCPEMQDPIISLLAEALSKKGRKSD